MEGPHTFTKILGRGIQNLRFKSTYPVKTQLDLIASFEWHAGSSRRRNVQMNQWLTTTGVFRQIIFNGSFVLIFQSPFFKSVSTNQPF